MAEPLSICVVDDDRDVAEGLAEILELTGHQVRIAFDGQDAVRIFAEVDCDFAFISATLPDLNTLESFMALRRAKPGMKAVLMTGYSIEQLLRQTVRDGSVSVLQKPAHVDEVIRALDGVGPKGLVLVAEDNSEIAAKISGTLRLQDHRVGFARSAGEALDMVFANECDVLVLDLGLTVVDALEVYLDLEKQGRALPTIVVSGRPDRKDGPVDLLRDPAVTGVLVKPFDPARLLASLAEVRKAAGVPPTQEPAEIGGQPNANVGRVLVIDDDRDLAEGLADILRDLGHTVEVAYAGSEALEIARRFDAQIALVDIKLGRTSGLELIGSLKELRPGIVNVVITANAGKESVIAAMRSGAFDFLNKPMHPQDLFVIMDRCFEQIRAQETKAKPTAESSSEFVANVSHGLRDPLNAVIGFSEILGGEMLGPLGSEQYVHYARGINEAGHHLTTVIDDLIDKQRPATETSKAEEPHEDDAEPQDAEPHAANSHEEHVEPAPAIRAPNEPHEGGTEVGGLEELDPGTFGSFADEDEEFALGRGEPSSAHPQGPGPESESPEPYKPQSDPAQPEQARLDRPEADTPPVEDVIASPEGAGGARLEANPPPREIAERNDPARTPVEPGDAGPPEPLFYGTIWDGDLPILPDRLRRSSAETPPSTDMVADPWPGETEPDIADCEPAGLEPLDRAWPDPGRSHPPSPEPPQFHPDDLAPSEPAWAPPAWEEPPAPEAPPAAQGTSETGRDQDPAYDAEAGTTNAGQRPPEQNRAIDPDEEEEEHEAQALEGREPAREVDDQENPAEKIVRLSPYRKVI